MVHNIITRLPEAREQFWQTFVKCARSNPAALRYIVILMAFYLHLGPFARKVIASIDTRLLELEVAEAAKGVPVSATVALHGPSRTSSRLPLAEPNFG